MKSITNLKYWSIGLTATITLIIFLCFTITQAVIVAAFAYLYPESSYEYLAYSNLGVISIGSSIIGFFVLAGFIRLKNNSIQPYLNIFKPKSKVIIVFLMLSFFLMLILELISAQYPHLFETDFAIKSYKEANSLPLFYLGVVFFGPVFEECLFRGFLFKGLEQSFLGGHGAVFVSSILFALVHIQYGIPILLFMLLPFSILLGYSRLKSGSLLLPILIHIINNFITCMITHSEVY